MGIDRPEEHATGSDRIDTLPGGAGSLVVSQIAKFLKQATVRISAALKTEDFVRAGQEELR